MATRESLIQQVPAQAEAPRSVPLKQVESKSLFVSFLELLFGRWMIIVGIFGSAVFWAYFALARAPDNYGATAQVLIRRGKLQAVQDVPVLRQQEEIGSEVDILMSIAVLNEAVKQVLERAQKPQNTDFGERPLIFDMYESTRPRFALTVSDLPTTDPAQLFKYLKNRFRIQKFGESNVIQVILESPNATFSAEAVNTLIDVYEKFNLKVDQSPGQSQFFAHEIRKIDTEIDTLQAGLALYKSAHGVVDIKRQQELVALRRHSVVSELDKLRGDKAAVETDLDAIRRGDAPATAFMRSDQMMIKMREELQLRVAELEQLQSKLTAENPLVVAKREEVNDLQKRVDEEEARVIAEQTHLYQQILDREKELTRQIREVDALLQEYPYVAAEIERLDRDITQRTIKRGDLVEQMFKSTTLESSDESLSKVKVIGYAGIPVLPVEARKDFKFLVAAVFSLILAFVAAGFVESLDHTVRKRDQIEQHLEIPHLASISTHYS